MYNIFNIIIRLAFEWKHLWIKSYIRSRNYASLKVVFLKEESAFFVDILACKNPVTVDEDQEWFFTGLRVNIHKIVIFLLKSIGWSFYRLFLFSTYTFDIKWRLVGYNLGYFYQLS